MTRALFPAIASLFITGAALAQTGLGLAPGAGYVNISTASGLASWTNSYFPGLTTNVNSTGIPGLNNPGCSGVGNCGLMFRQAPSTTSGAIVPNLRLQREATYTGGVSGTTVQSLFALTTTSPTGVYYEWPITSQMINQTHGSTGAQNVAINGTAQKLNVGGDSNPIGPTWAANFNCVDSTGVINPIYSCIGTEIDVQALAAAGQDTNRQRVALQLAWTGSDAPATSSLHFGTAILMGGNDGSTMDNAVVFNSGTGTYGNLVAGNAKTINGIDFNLMTFTGSSFLSPGFAIDGNGGASGGNAMTFNAAGVGNLINATSTGVNGVDLNGATFSGSAFLSPGFSVSGTGAVTAALPTSAGGGGIFVCVDTTGHFYKKATCP